MPQKRVAFCSVGWLLTPFGVQLAKALVERGLGVDIYFDAAYTSPVDVGEHASQKKIRFIKLSGLHRPNSAEEAQTYIAEAVSAITLHSCGQNTVFVGMEKAGAVIASQVARNLGAPCCYWSLELYDQHTHWYRNNPCGEFWLREEAAACKRMLAVIIQDEERASAFSDITGYDGQYIFFPVTVDAANVQRRGGFFLHDTLAIPREKKILLSYGYNRMPPPWIQVLEHWIPEPWVLVLHGLHMIGLENLANTERLVMTSGLPIVTHG